MSDRAGSRRTSRSAAAFVLLLVLGTALGIVGGPAIGRGVLHASDTLQAQAPWKAASPHAFEPHNSSTSDTVDATVPVRVEWGRRARGGDLPLWSDLQAAGAPLVALPNASAFSPLSIAWYVLPAWYAPAATKLLELAVAALFAFLLARRLGVGTLAAGIAATAFAGSGFQTVWTNWPHTHVTALVPALLWAVDRALDRRRVLDLVPIAVVSATMWFEGFPAITLWAHLVAGAYVLVRLGSELRGPGRRNPVRIRAAWRGAALAAGGVTAGAAVAAVQLLPFALRLGELDLAYREEKVGALPWRTIATMVVPDAFGNPAEKVFYGFRNYVEINAFVGVTVVVLAVAGLALGRQSGVPRRLRWFVAGAIAVCLGLIFVGGPPLAAFQRIPIVGPNAIGRLRGILALFVALEAAIGVDAVVRGGTDRRRALALLGGLSLAGIAAALLLGQVAGVAEAAGQRGYFADQLLLPAVAGAVAVLGTAFASVLRRRDVRVGVVALLAVVAAVELVAFARTYLPRIDRDLFYPVTPTHEFLARELGDDRYASTGFTMVPGTNLVYGLRSATAHSLTPASYADLLAATGPDVFERNRTYPVLPSSPELATAPVLDRMGVRYVVADPDVPVAGTPDVVTPATGQEHVAAGGVLTTQLPVGPLRAVQLQLVGPVELDDVTVVQVRLLDDHGEVLATGARRVLARTPVGPFDVAVAGLAQVPAGAAGPWTLEVRVVAAAGGATLATSAPGVPAVTLVRPADDGLTVAFADGSTIYHRAEALPRIRWASQAVVERDPRARVEVLTTGGVPDDAVLLSAPPGAGASAAGGTPAALTVRDDGGDELRVDVRASTAGYLVVADTLQDGWVATVDGEVAPLLEADHAFVAVAVPAGEHTVELRYVPPGWRVGLAATAGALLLMAGASLASVVAGRRRAVPAPDGRPVVAASPGPVS